MKTMLDNRDPITAQQLRAFRNADTLMFRILDGQPQIVGVRSAEKSSTGFEQEVRHHCAAAIRGIDWDTPETAISAFVHYGSFQFGARHIHTMLDQIKAGDRLIMHFCKSEGNGYLAGARSTVEGVCYDQPLQLESLEIEVIREMKNGREKRYTYRIDHNVSVNNSAQMIKA